MHEIEKAYWNGVKRAEATLDQLTSHPVFNRFTPKPGTGATGNVMTSLVNVLQKLRRGVVRGQLDTENIDLFDTINRSSRGKSFISNPTNPILPMAVTGTIGALLNQKPTDSRVIELEDGTEVPAKIDRTKGEKIYDALVGALAGGGLGYAASRGYYQG